MIWLLLIILFVLIIYFAGEQGFNSLITLCYNFFFFILTILLIIWGINPILSSLICCILVSLITLFFLNRVNKKTIASFISVIIVLIIVSVLVVYIGWKANLGGIPNESIENVTPYELDININMQDVFIGLVLIGLIGTIIDTSLAISSALHEVHVNNLHLSKKDLYISGINIGKDILGTTINTLFFAFFGGFIGYFIWYSSVSLTMLINYKGFVQEIIRILISALGSVLIIPVTSGIITMILKKDTIEDDYINQR